MAPKSKPKPQTQKPLPPPPFPPPLIQAPDALVSKLGFLPRSHIYLAHMDPSPTHLKKQIFVVPVMMNLAIAVAIAWRAIYAIPYWVMLLTSLRQPNALTFPHATASWKRMLWEILSRFAVLLMDFLLFGIMSSWPVDFAMGKEGGNPLLWRIKTGFRDREVYVRKSRAWDTRLGDFIHDGEKRNSMLSIVGKATNPAVLGRKSGYLLMGKEWDLDFAAMIHMTALLDDDEIRESDVENLVLIPHPDLDQGWLTVQSKHVAPEDGDERRKQVFLFRDALASLGKEDLFFRWIELVQFESSKPGGFSEERQVEAAKAVRELFANQGIDFDAFWKESVGASGMAGMES